MAGPAVDVKVFEEIFAAPSIEKMLALEWWDFEQFVKHVFECAGYSVEYVGNERFPEGSGVDLNLRVPHDGSQIVARVEVRRYDPSHFLNTNDVMALIGKLHVAGDVPGYLVTTSDFNQHAYAAATASRGNVRLISGALLSRYIRYVGGSRLTGDEAPLPSARIHLDPIAPDHLIDADNIRRRDVRDCTILAVANNKGGVAKTTTALNLALALADRQGKKVLLVDTDGQTSLTRALPAPGETPPAQKPESSDMGDFFAGRSGLTPVVRPTRQRNLWLLPSNRNLLRLDTGGGADSMRELEFVRAIHDPALTAPDGSPFDWIILDTPPAQSYYTRAAVAASHHVLIPACAETFAILGAKEAFATASTMRAFTGAGADVIGCCVTRWESHPPAEEALVALVDLARAQGTRVFQQRIPEDFRVERALLQGVNGTERHLFRWSALPGPAAKAHDRLLKEMERYVGRN